MSTISGTGGNDNLVGTGKADNISGGSGNDILSGLSGSDNLSGGSGNDVLSGGSGNDELSGGSGNDLLFGGTGNDELEGGSGNDVLLGGSGNDELEGDSGNDILIGGAGVDWLEGGSGRDVFGYLKASDSSVYAWDRILDFKQGQDKIDLSALLCEENLAWGNQSAIANGAWFLNSGSSTFVLVDLNGNGKADFKIELKDSCGLKLTADDFLGVGGAAPVAADDSVETTEASTPFSFAVTGNDVGANLSVQSFNASGTKGLVTFNPDGTFSYDSNGEFESLAQDAIAFDTFTYTVRDENGLTDTATVTVKVTGVNDAATISGDASGAVTEDGVGDSGSLMVEDVDTGEAVFQAVGQSSLAGAYGDFTFNEMTGAWTYTLDNSKSNVQALNGTAMVQDSLTVHSFDGTDSETITVNVSGANDAAAIAGKASGKVTEDGPNPLLDSSGKLNVIDVDTGEAMFQAPADLVGVYGDFTFDATSGDWTYTLRNSADNVQALSKDATTVQDSLTVFSLDGTASETITVDITGTNDDATITGETSGAVVEAGGVDNDVPGMPGASGDLDVNDVDTGEAVFQTPTDLVGTYGNFTFDALTGMWGYTLDQSKADKLFDGRAVTDTLMVKSFDGTASQAITVNITGSNDAPVAMADDGNATDGGNVLANDNDPDTVKFDNPKVTKIESLSNAVDNDETVVDGDAFVAGKFGTVLINNDGTWAYTLNDANPDTIPPANGESGDDVFAYKVVDEFGAEASSTLTVHVTGTGSSSASSTSSTETVTSAGGGGNGNGGGNNVPVAVADGAQGIPGIALGGNVLLNDSGDSLMVSLFDGKDLSIEGEAFFDGTYGSGLVTADGTWSYALNSAGNSAFAQSGRVTETFDYTVVDSDGDIASSTLTVDFTELVL